MFKRRKFSNKVIIGIVEILKATRKVLTVFALIGILWSYVPWNEIEAKFFDKDLSTEIVLDEPEVQEQPTIPDYPTTTDPDFDPSQVAIDFEVDDERTLTSKTFRKVDGTYEMAMYQDVIHYEDNGKLKNINNSLFDNGTDFENKDNKFKVKFPKKLDDNKKIKLSMDGYSIDWNILNIDSSNIEFDDTEITPNNIKELTHINQSLIYSNIQPNVDIEYIITGSKVKENIILNEYVPNFSLSFEYKLKDLTLEKDEAGNIVFINDSGEVVFTFEDLYMLDAEYNESFNVKFSYVQTGNKEYSITITPSDEWLHTAVYPVKVDPSIVLDGAFITNDIKDKYTLGTSSNDTADYIKVGNNGSLTYKSYIEISMGSIPNESIVTYAHLKLRTYSSNNFAILQIVK